jgi:hypothetical protein
MRLCRAEDTSLSCCIALNSITLLRGMHKALGVASNSKLVVIVVVVKKYNT